MPWGDEWRFGSKSGEIRIAVGGALRSNSAEMLLSAARAGVGITILPTWVAADDLRTGAIAQILPRWEPPASTIYAVYPGNRLMSAKVRAFVDHLARRFGKEPYWDRI
jgi:DNA-binding transcriptional LysR family regulator